MTNTIKILTITCALLFVSGASADYIKQSASGICHAPDSSYYSRTSNYQAFSNLDECLANGGRLPSGYVVSGSTETKKRDESYNRSSFRHWIDENRNCLNTRHELLKSKSTGPVVMDESGCRVIHGRWNDPYTGEIFLDSKFVDVDHLVPLRWAWDRGASTWDVSTRERFANDERNLFIVAASANRSKGAKGPDEWLPSNLSFQCQYVTRFLRVLILYDFEQAIRDEVSVVRQQVCNLAD